MQSTRRKSSRIGFEAEGKLKASKAFSTAFWVLPFVLLENSLGIFCSWGSIISGPAIYKSGEKPNDRKETDTMRNTAIAIGIAAIVPLEYVMVVQGQANAQANNALPNTNSQANTAPGLT